jgi:predicted transcriptional regulator
MVKNILYNDDEYFDINMQLDKILKQLGYSENETRVYLAALESGKSSAQIIALKAGLPRTTVYSVLKYLISRGVVAKTITKGKTNFIAEHPSKLISSLDDVKNALEEALPQFEAIYNKEEKKPKVLFYEGKGAMQKVYDDTLLEKPEEILEYNTEDYFKFDTFDVDPDYIKKRVSLGIKARRIAGYGSTWDMVHKGRDEKELSETLIVPKEKFDPHIEVNIYANKVAFLNYEEQMSIIIESGPLAEAMRQAYELSWKGARGNKS